MNLSEKRIVVTGGAGFLGSHVVEELEARECEEIFVPRSAEYNLTEPEAVKRLYEDARPEVVIHLAAVVGGIGANRKNPGRYFYENLIMGIELMEQARHHEVEKFVAIGTVCAYPKHTQVPFSEDDLWEGYPEETNAPYGLAKKMLLVQAQAYREQYGLNAIYLLPSNLYGPRDEFDPSRSHVIPALIKKCVDARETGVDHVTAWGTGKPTREFLYVEDATEAILLATEGYDGPDPMNIGTGEEVSIRRLLERIKAMTGFVGRIEWDETKPDGQPRRCLDVTRARKLIGFEASTSLEVGLRKTIDWYESSRENLSYDRTRR